MELGVNFNGANNVSQYSRKDIENLTKFVAGVEIFPQVESPFAGFGLMAGLTILPEIGKINAWNYKHGGFANAWKNDISTIKQNYSSYKNVVAKTGYSKETYKTLSETSKTADKVFLSEVADAKVLKKLEAVKAGKVTLWERVKGFFTGKSAAEVAEKKVGKLTERAATAAKEVTETSTKALTLGGKVAKFFKGNALFFAIEGAVELFSEVIPAFSKLGSDKGVKQVGKSSVKIAGSVGGWAAGAAAGAAIGSVLPIAGTAIGAVVGGLLSVVCGTIGSSIGTKAAKAVVGKSEMELAKEEEANKNANLALNDSNQMQNILAAAEQKLQTEGTNTPDANAALESYQRVASAIGASGQVGQDGTQIGGQADANIPQSSAQYLSQLDPNVLQYLSPQELAYLQAAYQKQSGSVQATPSFSGLNTAQTQQQSLFNPYQQNMFSNSQGLFA